MILRNQKVIGLYFRHEYNVHRIYRIFSLNLFYISTGCLKKTEFSQNQLWEIVFWLMRNPTGLFLTNLGVKASDNVLQCICNLQQVSDILIHSGQHFLKISSNIFLWLDMDTIGHFSTSLSVRPMQQCTWLPIPSCQALPSSSWQSQTGQPPSLGIVACSWFRVAGSGL